MTDPSVENQYNNELLLSIHSLLRPLEIEARDLLPKVVQQDCIKWTGTIETILYENDLIPIQGSTMYHCTNTSASDPHHWLEIDIPSKEKTITLIWDDSKQKIQNTSLRIKETNSNLWKGYFGLEVTRTKVSPDTDE